jgi:hypothetical protein
LRLDPLGGLSKVSVFWGPAVLVSSDHNLTHTTRLASFHRRPDI